MFPTLFLQRTMFSDRTVFTSITYVLQNVGNHKSYKVETPASYEYKNSSLRLAFTTIKASPFEL